MGAKSISFRVTRYRYVAANTEMIMSAAGKRCHCFYPQPFPCAFTTQQTPLIAVNSVKRISDSAQCAQSMAPLHSMAAAQRTRYQHLISICTHSISFQLFASLDFHAPHNSVHRDKVYTCFAWVCIESKVTCSCCACVSGSSLMLPTACNTAWPTRKHAPVSSLPAQP